MASPCERCHIPETRSEPRSSQCSGDKSLTTHCTTGIPFDGLAMTFDVLYWGSDPIILSAIIQLCHFLKLLQRFWHKRGLTGFLAAERHAQHRTPSFCFRSMIYDLTHHWLIQLHERRLNSQLLLLQFSFFHLLVSAWWLLVNKRWQGPWSCFAQAAAFDFLCFFIIHMVGQSLCHTMRLWRGNWLKSHSQI